MIKKERVVTVEGLRDGKGSVEIHHILEGEDLMGHGMAPCSPASS